MKKWQKGAMALGLATALVLPITLQPSMSNAASHKYEMQKIDVKDYVTLKGIRNSAAFGKAINSQNFGIGSSTKDIVKKWGKPSPGSDIEYLNYEKHGVNFVAKKGKVHTVVSSDKKYYSISYKEAIRAYGKPSKKPVFGEDGVYVTFKAGKHTLILRFAYDKKGTNPNTIIDVTVR